MTGRPQDGNLPADAAPGGLTAVRDVAERHRFEIELDGMPVGLARYRRLPGAIAFLHTEIDPAHEGRGLGRVLVIAALTQARREGLAVLPYCPFVRSFIEHHVEYLDLVPADRRGEFRLPHDR